MKLEFLDLDSTKLNDKKYRNALIREMELCGSIEQGAKLSLNSIYGALANKWFFWKNTDIAEAVTLQGQDEIKITESLMNDYFYNIFPKNRECLRKLGVSDDKEIVIKKPVVVYIDTDSCFSDTLINYKETIYILELEDDSLKSLKSLNKVKLNSGEIKYVKDLNEGDFILKGLRIKKIVKQEVTKTSKICNLFDEYSKLYPEKLGKTLKGNEEIELLNSGLKILNHNHKGKTQYDDVTRLIKHNVDKQLYKVEDFYGNFVCITGDHSLIIERYGEIQSVKCTDVEENDILISNLDGKIVKGNIKSIKPFEHNRKDVYDISVSPIKEDGQFDDRLQSFFGNNILIHNSNYCTFEEVRQVTGFKGSSNDLILTIYENGLKDYLENCFDKYVAELNGMGDYLKFELETISEVGIWIAKKKYMLQKTWEDGNYLDPSLKSTGVEIIQSSTSPFARKHLKNIVMWIMKKGKSFKKHFPDFVKYLKEIKEEFKLAKIEDVSKSNKINNYQKFVLQDKKELKLATGIPIHVRSAAIFNYLNYQNNLTNKYELIRGGDKIKWYYTTEEGDANVFAFQGGSFPYEMALEIDYNVQFEKTILSLVNRILIALGEQPLDGNLIYTISLF